MVVLDNLCNDSTESLGRVEQLAGCAPVFVEGDIRDRTLLDNLLAQHLQNLLKTVLLGQLHCSE